jgi:hypothetical protein
LQNYQSCVSPLQTFATHVWQDGQILRTLIIINYIQSFASKSTHDQPIYLSIYLSIYCIRINIVLTINNICIYNST